MLLRWLGVLLVAGTTACSALPAQQLDDSPAQLARWRDAPDWSKAGPEALGWLAAYLRVDTTNPPGNETLGAKYLAELLQREGIASAIVEFAPGRGSLIARLPATQRPGPTEWEKPAPSTAAQKPLCLLSHIDVVTAEAKEWPADTQPLSGVEKDGYLWGRGALDMKGMGILELATLVQLRRLKVPLQRDVILLAVADEEVDNRGMKELVARHWDRIGCSHLVNEGGLGLRGALYKSQTAFGISVAEKGLLWVRMTAHGKSGHGSVPLAGRAPDRLLDALQTLRNRKLVAQIHPTLYQSLAEMGRNGGGLQGFVLQRPGLVDWLATGQLMAEPASRAMIANTCIVTGFSGQLEPNVVPSEVSATLDCRLLPGTTPAQLLSELKRLVGDAQVTWQVVHEAAATESPVDDPLFRALARHAVAGRSDAIAGPLLSVGFTDSIYARPLGVRAYGFVPIEIDQSLAETMHGASERVPVAAWLRGLQVLYRAVVDVAADPSGAVP